MNNTVTDLLARCNFPPAGTHLSCAVSGGPDSLALLVLGAQAGCEVTAWHVDHGLRPDSNKDAAVVAAAANRWGAKFVACKAICKPGPNLESRARAARYEVLPKETFTGHTADDQAETVLLNLMRGAAVDGLAGMNPKRRPLLQLRRLETRNLCKSVGLKPIQDPSNLSLIHRRNRIRHELLPLLCNIAQRDIVPVITRNAAILGSVRDLLNELANDVEPTDAKALVKMPEPLAQVVLRRWIQDTTQAEHPINAATVQRVLAVARNEARSTEIGCGWRVTRSSQQLGLSK
ncbi:MAG: tRNA lysidine(34) synthetase TilS [Acidimicrobiia bacterium]|nr:tRNA lysidine(34) synthetase TilS [Acidimicrobiia bacterium]MYC57537.1 tRNA lysidine(34) synthetase TilS [Acidimicrobiia bacterium]MYG94828.1 tRNA lysidine(34) synthetase TilS [Acidimicrobiia bacterium]MYI30099.1 tRNA lysidine(34) synthetase TilS [Acidimicrobiia bacterium]